MEKEAGFGLIASSAVVSLDAFVNHCRRIKGNLRHATCHVDVPMLEANYEYIRYLGQYCTHGEWADQHDGLLLWYYLFLADVRTVNHEPQKAAALLDRVEDLLQDGTARRRREGRPEKPNSEVRWNLLRLRGTVLSLGHGLDGVNATQLMGQFVYMKQVVMDKLQGPSWSQEDRDNYHLSLALAELELIKACIQEGHSGIDGLVEGFCDAHGVFISPEPGYFRRAKPMERVNRYFPNFELYKLRHCRDYTAEEILSLQQLQLSLCEGPDAAQRYYMEYGQRIELRVLMHRAAAWGGGK